MQTLRYTRKRAMHGMLKHRAHADTGRSRSSGSSNGGAKNGRRVGLVRLAGRLGLLRRNRRGSGARQRVELERRRENGIVVRIIVGVLLVQARDGRLVVRSAPHGLPARPVLLRKPASARAWLAIVRALLAAQRGRSHGRGSCGRGPHVRERLRWEWEWEWEWGYCSERLRDLLRWSIDGWAGKQVRGDGMREI